MPSKLKQIKPGLLPALFSQFERDKLVKQTKQDPNNTALLKKFKKI